MSTFGQPSSAPAFGGAPVSAPSTTPWLAAGAAAVIVVVAAGWLGVVSPQRTAAADLRDSTAQVEVNEQALTARVTDLQQQFAALPEHQAKLAALQEQLPGDAALPELVRELKDVAARSGVQLTSLTPSAPVSLGGAATSTAQPAVADAAAGAAVAGSASPDATSAGTTTSEAAATGSADAATNGLLQVPVTLTASGPYSSLMTFLAGIQQEQRLLLVTGTTVTTGTQTTAQSGLVLTVNGAVFTLPGGAADASTTTSAGASSTGAAAGTPAAAPPTTTNLN